MVACLRICVQPIAKLLPWLLSLHLSLSSLAAGAQASFVEDSEFFIEYIDISSGLSNNYVSKITEDQFGMMWFASEGAVNRFDGKNFKHFKPGERYAQLLNENIESVFIDKKEKVWVGTKSGGVSIYDPITDSFENLNDKLLKGAGEAVIQISDFAEDAKGNIWVSTWGRGLFLLSSDRHELIASFLDGVTIQDIELDQWGNLWIAGNHNLYRYDATAKHVEKLSVSITGMMALLYESSTQQLLIGTAGGLMRMDVKSLEISEFVDSERVQMKGINSLNVDRKGRIWAGSWTEGLYLSNSTRDRFEKFSLNPSTNTVSTNYDTVLDIFIDKNDFVWVATGYGGVVKLSPRKSLSNIFHSFENDIDIQDNNIQAVTIDTKGALWCGTWGRGIGYSLNGRNFRHLEGEDIARTKVSDFLQIGDHMLVGTAKGLYSFDINKPENGPLSRVFPYRKIKDLMLDSKQRLWVGTQEGGLLVFDYKNDPTFSNPTFFNATNNPTTGLFSERISKMAEDMEGNIWIGTYYGLYLFNESNATFKRMDVGASKFPSVIVLSILTTREGDLWFGVPGGLLQTKYENGQLRILKTFNTGNGLRNDFVTAVTQDAEGNIWISNASGIATVRKESNAIVNLQSNQDRSYAMNINSYYNSGDQLYFGSSNGLFYFDPYHIDLLKQAPDLIFSSLKVDNREVSVGEVINERILLKQTMPFIDKLEISHRESIVSIGFVPKHFKDFESLSFHYRVLGLQDNWINYGNSTEINFIGLNTGSYVLEVKATRDNVHFGEVAKLNISVLPPPWLSAWTKAVYFIVLVVLIILISQFFVNRAKLRSSLVLAKMSQEKEHELNEAKLRFFTNISHELRTPLTLIISPLTEILSNNKLPAGVRERLTYMDQNARRLLDLINQLLDFRKAEKGELKLRVVTLNFAKFVKEVYLSFKGYAETQGVVYEFETSSDHIELTFDRDKMEMLVCNLLSNAFKFTSPKGKVKLSIYEDAEHCYIRVSDTGRGISQEYQDKIFNRFFQIQDTNSAKVVGSGIGLSLSKKIAELHHGDIAVASKMKQGTDFTVTLRKGTSHFESTDFLEGFVSSEDISRYPAVNEVEKEKQLIESEQRTREKILIVDDNQDIRSYTATIFKEKGYDILTAENGRSGKDLALEEIPDLIISDIMMPEMDGIELCRHLKKDIRTSHIPIILLTARTSTVYEVDGLDTGADDYVRKPFDVDVIKARVASLLENRQHVRASLLNKLRFEVSPSVQPLNKEEKFIDDISKRIEENIDNESFSIDVLADELCMSQSTLYRKIKSLTGMSIAGFMRSIRLKKAAEFLITEDLNMSQAAYKAGFNDYKYFKKSFKEQFGCLPSEYVERHKANRNSSANAVIA